MMRPWPKLAFLFVGLAACISPTTRQAHAAEPESASQALEFVKGLRERGYYDLALEYLDELRKAPGSPSDVRTVIDYEAGRCLLEEASHTADLEVRRQKLDQARTRLDAFVKDNPNHTLAPEALVQLARLLVERGHLSVLQADDLKVDADKLAKLTEARSSFGAARTAYDKAQQPLRKLYESFPKYIPETDPRHEARERAHNDLMEAQLQRALVDYEEAQTFPIASKERNDLLNKGVAAFEAVYKEHRTQFAGLYANMWQGKCYEEQGELGKAMGIYNGLMEHGDPSLRPLQRQVGYFRILVIAKRKEFALAADEAVRWLQSNPGARRSPEYLGVQLELAKNILAQLDELKGAEHDQAIKKATDALSEVVRYYSPHKAEALALLQKYKPKAAAGATIPSTLTFEDAMAQADVAISGQEWPRAIALLKAAVRRADPNKEIEKANRARYMLAYVYYQSQHYYEADVLVEHLARRYPHGGLSAKATSIGMASLTFAYNTYTERDRTADLQNLIHLAEYTAETWPDSEEGDSARVTLGEIYLGMGKYAEAAKAFEAVRSSSGRHADALAKAGLAHWKQSGILREAGKTAEADAETKTADGLYNSALKTRKDAGAAPTDPGLIGTSCDLADLLLATDRAKDALALIDPLVKALGTNPPSAALAPLASRMLALELQAHIGVDQVDLALADMARLETLGSGTNLTQLYYQLGKLLKKELDAREARNDHQGYARIQKTYLRFLQALAESKSGQNYESLQWSGEQMLALNRGKEAGVVFERVLKTYRDDPAFQKLPNSSKLIFRTELRQASAYRLAGEFDKARSIIDKFKSQQGGLLEPLVEEGLLYEAQAQADKAKDKSEFWKVALEHWRRLAAALGRKSPKPVEYYDASYHVAYCLKGQGQKDKAKQALHSVMRLSPRVGNAEMKAKYEALLRELGG